MNTHANFDGSMTASSIASYKYGDLILMYDIGTNDAIIYHRT